MLKIDTLWILTHRREDSRSTTSPNADGFEPSDPPGVNLPQNADVFTIPELNNKARRVLKVTKSGGLMD